MRRFRDRQDAGQRLAELLTDYGNRDDVVILGLPRGGVPVACEIAKALKAPLDVYIVRKLGVPGQEELAMGAIASDGARVMNDEIVRGLNIRQADIDRVVEKERRELLRQKERFCGGRQHVPVNNKTVILVDDGLATGASMKVAVQAVQLSAPKEVIVAIGTAPHETLDEFRALEVVDHVVAALIPPVFYGVGGAYENFVQTTDEEVMRCLAQSQGQA